MVLVPAFITWSAPELVVTYTREPLGSASTLKPWLVSGTVASTVGVEVETSTTLELLPY